MQYDQELWRVVLLEHLASSHPQIHWDGSTSGMAKLSADWMNPLQTDSNCKLWTKPKKQPPEGTIDTWEKGIVCGKPSIYYGP